MENGPPTSSRPREAPQHFQRMQNDTSHFLQVNTAPVYFADGQDGEVISLGDRESILNGCSTSSDHVGHSLRSIDFGVLFSALKASLGSLFTSNDSSESSQERGILSRALALSSGERVDTLRQRYDHGHGSRIRALLLEQSLTNMQGLEGLGGTAPTGENHSVNHTADTDVKVDEVGREELGSAFDFLSLSALAAVDLGLFVRPSWKQLAPYVGSIARMQEVLQQLQQRRLRAVEQFEELNKTVLQVVNDIRIQRENCKSDSSVDQKAGEFPPQGAEVALRNSFVPIMRKRYASKELKCQQQCLHLQEKILQMEEDIGILRKAQAELRTLLRFVWRSAGLSPFQEVSRRTFRRLWCTDARDASQIAEADKLFWLCYQSHCRSCMQQLAKLDNEEQSVEGANLSFASASLALRPNGAPALTGGAFREERILKEGHCGSQEINSETPLSQQAQQQTEATLSFDALSLQLPPRSFECLWYAAEVRRKRKQLFRYFWL